MTMHDDQLDVDEGTVRRLVATQFPQWRDLPIREQRTAGTVNAIFRIGDDLAARFPLQPIEPSTARAWLHREAAAARELAPLSSVPVPAPVAIGEPGEGYPLPWSMQTWLPGSVATDEDPAESTAFAEDLARFVAGLRAADAGGRRFHGEGRGGHLPDHDVWVGSCFAHSEHLLDVPPLRALWADLRTLPSVEPDALCHGDLTPSNVLVRDGRLVGVLDAGGFAAADPALDLVGAWHLLDEPRRTVLRDALGCGEVQWLRGKAWALEQAIGAAWYYVDSNATMSRWALRTLHRLAGGAG
ncbi:MAG: aminoglycoside phosphotransferase family protein [Nocardioidaceae bacterium]